MGYSITIGELSVEKHPDDGLDCSCIGFDAKGVRLDDAPAFGEPTDFTNSRWPSYCGWADSLQECGLHDLFFCEGHLIGGHPGIRLVTKALVDEVNARMAKLESENPTVIASYEDKSNGLNAFYCRAFWLRFWLNWAIENCENPVIANS